MGFLADFWLQKIFGGAGFLALYRYFIEHLVSFTDKVGQSIANMLLKALYRLKFAFYILFKVYTSNAKKVAKNVLFC
jgi:hypothetical protein